LIAWGTILFFLVLAGKLFLDYRKFIKRGRSASPIPINHGREWLFCAALLLPSIYMLTAGHPAYEGFPWQNNWHWRPFWRSTFWLILCVSGMEAVTFWFLFDGMYNLLRGEKWNFLGSFNDPGHEDAVIDKLAQKIGGTLAQFIKIVGASAMIIVYIISILKNIHSL
jgi:hypothetical protein